MKKSILKQLIIALITVITIFSTFTYLIMVVSVNQILMNNIVAEVNTKQYMMAEMCEVLQTGVNNAITPLFYGTELANVGKRDLFKKEELEIEEILLLYDLLGVMEFVKNSNSYIESIYVHFLEDKHILSTNYYRGSEEEFYDIEWVEQSQQFKEGFPYNWIRGIVGYDDGIFSIQGNYIRYIYSYTYGYTGQSIVIVVNYDMSVLADILKSDDETSIIVLNQELHPIYTDLSGEILGSDINLDELYECMEDDSSSGFWMDGDDIITYIRDLAGNYYIEISDYSVLVSEYQMIILMVFLFVGVGIIFLTIVWYKVMMKIYNPFTHIIYKINNFTTYMKKPTLEDEKYLVDAVDELIEQVRYGEIIKQQNQIFNGLVTYQKTDMECEYLTKEFFTAIYISVDNKDFSKLDIDLKQEVLDELYKLLNKRDIDVVAHMVQSGYELIISFDLDQRLHQVEKNNEEIFYNYSDRAIRIFNEMVECVRSTTTFTATIGIGDVYNHIEHISVAYEDAIKRSKMRLLLGRGQIVFTNTVEEINYVPEKEMQQLKKAIESGNKDKITEIFDTIIRKVKSNQIVITIENVPSFIYYLCFGISSCAKQDESITTISYVTIERELNQGTFEDILNYLKECAINIVVDKSDLDYEQLNVLNVVSNYVKENYNKDIDVTTIANEIGISYTKLRKILLKANGVNVVEYVNKLRIKEAKELLTTTDQTNIEIACKIGYNNEQSFNRYFKKFEQVTPGEYRKSNRR